MTGLPVFWASSSAAGRSCFHEIAAALAPRHKNTDTIKKKTAINILLLIIRSHSAPKGFLLRMFFLPGEHLLLRPLRPLAFLPAYLLYPLTRLRSPAQHFFFYFIYKYTPRQETIQGLRAL